MSKGTRRRFLRQTGVGLLATSGAIAAPDAVTPVQIIEALGDTLIPTEEPRYPGYRRLERFHISGYVWNQLRVVDRVTAPNLALFNESPEANTGKTFVELDPAQRATYVEQLFAATESPTVPHKVLLQARERIFSIFYHNFPYQTIDRDEKGTPIASDQLHQIINPKKSDAITGWDIAGYRGPLSWAEEEQRRARFRKIHWHEKEPA